MAIPKLKDIAVATGVHEMTVSRALRNVGRMRPETRQRVLDVARTMGYRPNAAAAAMRTGHTGCIAMILGCGTHHGRATDIDILDRFIQGTLRPGYRLLEGVEIHHHQVNRRNIVCNHCRQVFR